MQTQPAASKPAVATRTSVAGNWIEPEMGGCNWGEVRRARRFGKLLGRLSDGIGQSVPHTCQDRANTRAACRFFSNDGVSEDQILAGHFQATRRRRARTGQQILMLHDTCEFTFQREKGSKIGLPGRTEPVSRARAGGG